MKGILIAGIMAVSFLAGSANAATVTELVKDGGFNATPIKDWSFSGQANSGQSQTQDRGVVVFSNGQARFGSLWQTIALGAGNYSLAFDAISSVSGGALTVSLGSFINDTFSVGTSAVSKTYNFSVSPASAGSFNLTFSGTLKGTLAVDNVSVGKIASVPGPEAGAGLGALAMGGVAFLLHRRRQKDGCPA